MPWQKRTIDIGDESVTIMYANDGRFWIMSKLPMKHPEKTMEYIEQACAIALAMDKDMD